MHGSLGYEILPSSNMTLVESLEWTFPHPFVEFKAILANKIQKRQSPFTNFEIVPICDNQL